MKKKSFLEVVLDHTLYLFFLSFFMGWLLIIVPVVELKKKLKATCKLKKKKNFKLGVTS